MVNTHHCTYAGCNEIFTQAYELKKHKAAHDDPNSLFRCPHCKFITLRKRSLGIHIATHTGEKKEECPHMVRSGADEHRCDYRTNDPAALLRHRRKEHSYVPPNSSRSRATASASTRSLELQKEEEKPKSSPSRRSPRTQPIVPLPPRKAVARSPRKTKNGAGKPSAASIRKLKLQQKKEKKPKSSSSRRRPRTQPIAPSPRRKAAARSPRKTKNAKNGAGKPSTPVHTRLLRPLANVDDNAMDTDGFDVLGYESVSVTLVGTDDEMGLDTLFDPTLRSEWMSQYEASYTSFDMTGMRGQLEAMADDHTFEPVALSEQSAREGCLCPEWMAEAGIEGWDKSVLEGFREYCIIDA